MGILPSEVEEIGSGDFDLLRRYWLEEPWGPWRDNIHTAMIAREVRRGNFKGSHTIEEFMLVGRAKQVERAKSAKNNVISFFKAVAQKRKVKKGRAS